VLEVQPNEYQCWNNRGYLLLKKCSSEGMSPVYEKALEIGFIFQDFLNKKSPLLSDLEHCIEALNNFDKVLELKPDFEITWANRGFALYYLGRYEEAIESCNKALEFKYDDYVAWSNKGFALMKLDRYEEAIVSFDRVIEIKPDNHTAWYNKACCYASQNNVELALQNLQQAINIEPEKYRKMAKNDSYFDSIREDNRFRALIQEPL
jgi:superkiller protein 3